MLIAIFIFERGVGFLQRLKPTHNMEKYISANPVIKQENGKDWGNIILCADLCNIEFEGDSLRISVYQMRELGNSSYFELKYNRH